MAYRSATTWLEQKNLGVAAIRKEHTDFKPGTPKERKVIRKLAALS